MRTKDCHRFATEINNDKVVVPTDNQIASVPKWDVFRNNPFTMRKRLLDIFLKVANKLILRRRAGQRLTKLKKAFLDNNVTNRKECKKWVADDWKQAALSNIQGDDPSALENIENIRYTLHFTKD